MMFYGYDDWSPMKPLFLGSHPALDFLNTRPTPRGVPIELIGDGTSYAAWLEDARLLQATTAPTLRRRFGAAALDAAAAQARVLREWARDWIARWQDAPGGAYRAELRRLNQLMARATCYPEIVSTKDGFQVTERWRIDSADALIAVVAAQIASLVATEQPALVKRCAVPGARSGSSIARKRTGGCSAAQRRAGTERSRGVPRTSTSTGD